MKKQERAGHSFLASSSDEGGADFQQEEIFFKCPLAFQDFKRKGTGERQQVSAMQTVKIV